MRIVGTHGLTCPEGDDYAAIALSMQANAQALDSALTVQGAALDVYNNRPYMIWTTTTTTDVSSVLAPTGGDFNATDGQFVAGTGVLGSSATATIQQYGMDILAATYPVGWWLMGASCSYAPLGGVNVNTRRLLCVQMRQSDGVSTTYDNAVQTNYESNTGGDAMTVTAPVHLRSALNHVPNVLFQHQNPGSQIRIATGLKFWMVYMGSGLTV